MDARPMTAIANVRAVLRMTKHICHGEPTAMEQPVATSKIIAPLMIAIARAPPAIQAITPAVAMVVASNVESIIVAAMRKTVIVFVKIVTAVIS